jgi:peptidoglycan/xylan/chitin deacetylase (PgdA/CDA1 family)
MSKERDEMNAQSNRPLLAILSFHKIGEPPPNGWSTWFYISEKAFVRQLRFLERHNWKVIDLATFLRGLAEPESLPRKAALLTFDDGYRSIRRIALPWLRRLGYPAVLFMPTRFIGRTNSFDLANEPRERMCDWDDLRELERWGISVQSHGLSHRPFPSLDATEQKKELIRSKRVLEKGLGKSVEVFAFPYGADGQTAKDRKKLRRALEQAGYRAACLYGGRPKRLPISNPYRLPRLAMGPDTSLLAELERGILHERG